VLGRFRESSIPESVLLAIFYGRTRRLDSNVKKSSPSPTAIPRQKKSKHATKYKILLQITNNTNLNRSIWFKFVLCLIDRWDLVSFHGVQTQLLLPLLSALLIYFAMILFISFFSSLVNRVRFLAEKTKRTRIEQT
jgi:hypothetical protein